MPTDVAHRAAVLLGQCKIRSHSNRPVDEQADRFNLGQRGERELPPIVRNVERRQSNDGLTGDVEPLAAGAYNPHLFALRHHGSDQRPTSVDQVLTVIEHQQRPPLL